MLTYLFTLAPIYIIRGVKCQFTIPSRVEMLAVGTRLLQLELIKRFEHGHS